MQVTNLNSAIKQITVGGVNYSLTGSSYIGTTAEWDDSSYIPAHGELIIYNDNGKIQFKIGDGITLAKNLPFANYIIRSTVEDCFIFNPEVVGNE